MNIQWIWTCNQIFRKCRYCENLLVFWMMLNKASSHLWSLGNNIYTKKSFPTYWKSKIEKLKKCEICSKLVIKTPEQLSTIFIGNFGHISRLFPVFLLLLLTSKSFLGPAILIFNCWNNILLVYKSLSEIPAHRKRLWFKVVVLKKHFVLVGYCV